MPNDKSLNPYELRDKQALSSDAEDWGRQFMKHLELEYAVSAIGLPANAAQATFRQAMLVAILEVLHDSGASHDDIAQMVAAKLSKSTLGNSGASWTDDENTRRLQLIDKWIGRTITDEESVELHRLTDQLRTYCDNEINVPLEGARELHRQLLTKDRL